MNKMIVFWLFTFLLFYIGHVNNYEIENEVDLTANYELDDGYGAMEAYRSIRNDEILKGNKTHRFGELLWYSIGYPTLAHYSSKNTSFSISKFFEINPLGFDLLIKILTHSQKEVFKEAVKSRYGIDIKTTQITNLVPSELKCRTIVVCSNRKPLTLYGKAIDLKTHPLRVEFDAPMESDKFECFEHQLIELNQLSVHCEIRQKSKKVNTFSITSEQMSKSNLFEKLFGNANEVYVTREQMAELASEIHHSMNVYKQFEIREKEFVSGFIDELIKQNVADFKPVPIETVLNSLSKYSTKNLDPNIIKKNLSKVLRVKTVGDKKHITTNSEYSKSNSEKDRNEIDTSIEAGYDGFSASASFNYVKEKERDWANSGKSIDDQLRELNSHSQDSIEWEIEGEKIVPKSINVSRLLKTSFNEKLNFEKITKTVDDNMIDTKFSLRYKNDKLYKRIAKKSIDKFNRSSILYCIKTRSLIECIEACEENPICHYAQFSDNVCSLSKKIPFDSLKDESGNKQRLYERRIISQREQKGYITQIGIKTR